MSLSSSNTGTAMLTYFTESLNALFVKRLMHGLILNPNWEIHVHKVQKVTQ